MEGRGVPLRNSLLMPGLPFRRPESAHVQLQQFSISEPASSPTLREAFRGYAGDIKQHDGAHGRWVRCSPIALLVIGTIRGLSLFAETCRTVV